MVQRVLSLDIRRSPFRFMRIFRTRFEFWKFLSRIPANSSRNRGVCARADWLAPAPI